MANSLLQIGILPPLLVQQISPPYRIIACHLDYLQKWREYLLAVWIDDSDENVHKIGIQQSVDELISTILLIDYVGRSHPTAIPSLEEILKFATETTGLGLCEAVYNRVSCKLLRAVFNPNRLSEPAIGSKKDFESSSLINISEVVEGLYGSRMPLTLLGDFYQLCLDRPVSDKRNYRRGSDRRDKGVYLFPVSRSGTVCQFELGERFK